MLVLLTTPIFTIKTHIKCIFPHTFKFHKISIHKNSFFPLLLTVETKGRHTHEDFGLRAIWVTNFGTRVTTRRGYYVACSLVSYHLDSPPSFGVVSHHFPFHFSYSTKFMHITFFPHNAFYVENI